ncbi:hypothetical protein XN66_05935 [Listeria monocytogenes]|nr:hypothetical protein [Listeria monocytogenes]EAD7025976.1 hypothetical protein [Listeria monocytogenes]EAD7031986.1 hypothetical protein [Listeria monocytogenes]EAD7037813.1 hypothetical protein [Listeria monocytogenes]
MLPLFYVISHYSNLPFRAWEQRKFIEIINRLSKTSNSSILPKVEYEDIGFESISWTYFSRDC